MTDKIRLTDGSSSLEYFLLQLLNLRFVSSMVQYLYITGPQPKERWVILKRVSGHQNLTNCNHMNASLRFMSSMPFSKSNINKTITMHLNILYIIKRL